MSTASYPSTVAPASPFTLPIYRPSDVADMLGLDYSTVTHQLRRRPGLFPAPNGWCYEFTAAQMPGVLLAMLCLSKSARRNLAARLGLQGALKPAEILSQVIRNPSCLASAPA